MTELQPILPQISTSSPLLICGPCSAESLDQVVSTAHAVKNMGVEIFRAGIWKPRTRPGGFEGVGAVGLEWLEVARQQTGLKIAIEVATPQHVKLAIDHHIDLVWIGARTCSNPFAVQEIANSLKGSDIGVLIKNPLSPDLELWIGALQRLYNAGVRRLGAIHRGFGTSATSPYRNTPCWALPIELRRRYPNLTIISDPSHIGGRRELIKPLAQQALSIGLDGMMIETHPTPDTALSDSQQQLTPEQLSALLATLNPRSATAHETFEIEQHRAQIDKIDAMLLDLLSQRMEVIRQIGNCKSKLGMQVLQPTRYNTMLRDRIEQGTNLGLDPKFVRDLLEVIHTTSVNEQSIVNPTCDEK